MNIDLIFPLSVISNKVKNHILNNNDINKDSDYFYDANLIDIAIINLIKKRYCFKSKMATVCEYNHEVESYSNTSDIPILKNYEDAEKHAIFDLSKWVSCEANYLKRLKAGKII